LTLLDTEFSHYFDGSVAAWGIVADDNYAIDSRFRCSRQHLGAILVVGLLG
jgi:hypothetical protein